MIGHVYIYSHAKITASSETRTQKYQVIPTLKIVQLILAQNFKNSDIGKYSSRDLEKPHQVVGPLVQSPRFSFNDQHSSFEMEFELFF